MYNMNTMNVARVMIITKGIDMLDERSTFDFNGDLFLIDLSIFDKRHEGWR